MQQTVQTKLQLFESLKKCDFLYVKKSNIRILFVGFSAHKKNRRQIRLSDTAWGLYHQKRNFKPINRLHRLA